MEISMIKAFFMWCTIINGSLLVVSSVICIGARKWIYRVHGRMFPMSEEHFDIMLYAFLGMFKIVVITFCLVPFIALCIIGG